MYLGFDNKDNVFTKSQLNGQVTGVLWNTQGDDAQRKYDYTYDNAGRLTDAKFEDYNATWMDLSVKNIAYDLNGNLLTMQHQTFTPGSGTTTIDDLHYTYASLSNKLQSVTDASSDPNNGKQGDFKDGSNGTAPDYVYDNNGNVVIDLNKNAKDLNNQAGANGIHYNFLDKPDQIRIAGKGTIKIIYSGDGEKLQRIFTPESGTATTTTYINQFVYQSSASGDQLSYISFEEGRIRAITPTAQNNGYDMLTVDGNMDLPDGRKGVYDYFILDYQQNVRMILSEETHVASGTATMEPSRSADEAAVFGNAVAGTRWPRPQSWTGNSSDNVSRVRPYPNGSSIGPNTVQKVMAGDVINATVKYYFNSGTPGNRSQIRQYVVSSLIGALTNGPATTAVKDNLPNINYNLNLSENLYLTLDPFQTEADVVPRARLIVLFFDERMNLVGMNGSDVSSTSMDENGRSLTVSGVKVPKNGYAYVYVSNQSDMDVYFDDFKVSVAQGNIIEENHYYAFGLKIAAISSKKYADTYDGNTKNNFQMQGAFSEMDDDIGWNDFALRNYDPQIGRWVQIDPYADNYLVSPYVGMADDPMNMIDPNGGEPLPFLNTLSGIGKLSGEVLPTVIVSTTKVAASGAKVISTLDLVLRTSNLIIQLGRVINILTKSDVTIAIGDRSDIYARGMADAILNANTLGITDLWGSTSNLTDYKDPYDQEAYLKGRLAGDAVAIAQSATEIESGIGGGASGALFTGGTSLIAGGAVTLHGAAVGVAATNDAAWATAKLVKLNLSSKTSTGRSPNSKTNTPNKKYPKDYATKNTKDYSAYYKSEREARNLARQKLGKNPVEIEPGKWRSADGKWQFRAKPGDISEGHIHLEQLNPQTGEVLQNFHLRWK
jgi:RHS repeat-associated protein